MSNNVSESDPISVLRTTQSVASEPGDVADAADRLTMIMEAEAIRNSLNGDTGEYGGEGSLDGLLYPLEDTEYFLAGEDGVDSSDDPMHAGVVSSPPIISAEVAAMHYIDTDEYVDDESDQEKAQAEFDQYDERVQKLTPEDETLLGVDLTEA